MKEKQTEEVFFEIKKIPFINNGIRMDGDKKQKIFPTSIKFILNDNQYELEYIIHSIGKIIFIVRIGGYNILSIPLNFFISLYGYEKKEKIIKIPLEFKMFYEHLIFYAKYQNIEFVLSDNTNVIYESILKIKVSKYTGNIPEITTIQQITTTYKEDILLQTVSVTLDEITLTKGFFISSNLDDISKIKLLLNETERFDYDEILLSTICKKINNNLFYIPLDISQEYTDCTEKSYCSALNLERIANVRFIFTFKNIPKNIYIYTLGLNYTKHNGEYLCLIYPLPN